jgi:hypothetical protein
MPSIGDGSPVYGLRSRRDYCTTLLKAFAAWTKWHFGREVFCVAAARTPPSRRSAMPRGVSAADMTEAGDVRDEDLVGAEGVSVGALGQRFGHPLAFGSPRRDHPRPVPESAFAVKRDSATGARNALNNAVL